MKNAQFNLNSVVSVYLTEYGVNILRQRHNEYQYNLKVMNRNHTITEFVPPENNMYTTQMWYLMEVFGEYMGLAKKNAFDLFITLRDVDSQKAQQLKEEKEQVEAENENLKVAIHNIKTLVESLPQGPATKRKILAELSKVTP